MLTAVTMTETPVMNSAEKTPGVHNSHDVPAGRFTIPVVFVFRRLLGIVKLIPVTKLRPHMHFRRDRLCALLCVLSLLSASLVFLSSVEIGQHLPGLSRVNKDTKGSSRKVAEGCKGPGVMGEALVRAPLKWCRPLGYLEPPQPVVALAAYPSSGSTWLRYLLQQATGIYTKPARKRHRRLGKMRKQTNGSVLVAATHDWDYWTRSNYRRAIVLVRKPGPAIISEFNTRECGYIDSVNRQRYSSEHWQSFFKGQLSLWRSTYLDWLLKFEGEVMVIRYEELVDSPDLGSRLRPILRFLQIDQNVSDDQLSCAVSSKDNLYRRSLWFEPDDPYTGVMKRNIRWQEKLIFDVVQYQELLQQLQELKQQQNKTSNISDKLTGKSTTV